MRKFLHDRSTIIKTLKPLKSSKSSSSPQMYAPNYAMSGPIGTFNVNGVPVGHVINGQIYVNGQIIGQELPNGQLVIGPNQMGIPQSGFVQPHFNQMVPQVIPQVVPQVVPQATYPQVVPQAAYPQVVPQAQQRVQYVFPTNRPNNNQAMIHIPGMPNNNQFHSNIRSDGLEEIEGAQIIAKINYTNRIGVTSQYVSTAKCNIYRLVSPGLYEREMYADKKLVDLIAQYH